MPLVLKFTVPTFWLIASLGLALSVFMPHPVRAQTGTSVTFGGLNADTKLPVEITSDQLSVDQASGQARFDGNVVVTQGEMKLSAASILVVYADASGKIERLIASGGVLIVNAKDAAEADEAVYTIDTGEVVMQGNVALTQGTLTLTSQKMVIDLKSGLGRLEGGVKTQFQPEGGN